MKKCKCICHMLPTKFLMCTDCRCVMCAGCSKWIVHSEQINHGNNCKELKKYQSFIKKKYKGKINEM